VSTGTSNLAKRAVAEFHFWVERAVLGEWPCKASFRFKGLLGTDVRAGGHFGSKPARRTGDLPLYLLIAMKLVKVLKEKVLTESEDSCVTIPFIRFSEDART
jgi:hypothetical protein